MIGDFITDYRIDYLGALLRFIYYKYVRREKVRYSNFLTETNVPKTKDDKALYNENCDKNSRWSFVFLIIVSAILGICFT